MMPIICVNNDQNINRAFTKMSEQFTTNQNNTKLLSPTDNNVNYFDSLNNRDDLELSYDHIYATNNDNNINLINLTDNNCQTAESEVKFLKDWLILHLDLIQQQNDEILNKERTILILQQENEMLKDRISCMERGAPYQETKYFNNHTKKYLEDDFKEDMTQSSGQLEEDNKNDIDLLGINSDNDDEDDDDNNNDAGGDEEDDVCTLKLNNFTDNNNELSDNESQNNLNHNNFNNYKNDVKFINNLSDTIKSESAEVTDCNISNNCEFDCPFNSPTELDPVRNLRMSIRRKRLCSNSSAISNNDSVLEEKRSFRRFKKRRKRIIKDSQILTTPEPYITQIDDLHLGLLNNQSAPVTLENNNNTNLEVPRWRVKVYSSCYTMEGTENLDNEIYNKRHSRLEHDERRRKRWDVQRIREQRVIEKLKQRQERVGSGSRNDERNINLQSFWPKIEDIKYLEVSDQLPVAAFGCPVSNTTYSEFSLPWYNNPDVLTIKKVPTRRSTGRRKNTKR